MSESAGPPEASLEALRQSEGEYRRLVELSPDMVLLCGPGGRILYANLVGAEMLGFECSQEIVGREVSEFVHPGSRAVIIKRLADLTEDGENLPFVEARFVRADGSAFEAEVMGYPFVHRGQNAAYLVVQDATRRKQAEAAQRRLKRRLALVTVLGCLLLVGSGSYQLYRYSESSEFCGTLCHSVMGPQDAEHKASPHAHVSCAECHIGSGAEWYVKAKLSGIQQVYATLMRTYPKPLPTPIVNLRPAAETCGGCHSPRVFYGNLTNVTRTVPEEDQAADPQITAVTLHVGGHILDVKSYVGIHWHNDPRIRVEYQASDAKRLHIKRVRVTDRNGEATLFTSADVPEPPTGTPWRKMDCLDCHNRVSHGHLTVEQSVDRLLLNGRLNFPFPEVKRASVAALSEKYPTLSSARRGILASLTGYYKPGHPDLCSEKPKELGEMAATLYQEAYSPNVDPDLGIAWDTYPDHNGHASGFGCFRCHDEQHVAEGGRSISQDCGLCHTVLAESIRESKVDPALKEVLFSR